MKRFATGCMITVLGANCGAVYATDADRQRMEAERKIEKRPAPSEEAKRLFEEAVMLERQGKGAEAVKLYVRAARAGNDKAALRLAEIYEARRRQVETESWLQHPLWRYPDPERQERGKR